PALAGRSYQLILPRKRRVPAKSRMSGVLSVPFLDLGDHVIHLVGHQFGEHRKADTAGGVGFGIGDAADNTRPLPPRITRLVMDGDRVMSLGVDVVLYQEVYQLIA